VIRLDVIKIEEECKPIAYLSFHNQYKYCQLAENYKLSVKLPFGIVGLALIVQPYYKEEVEIVLEWLIPKVVKNVQKFLGLANYYR